MVSSKQAGNCTDFFYIIIQNITLSCSRVIYIKARTLRPGPDIYCTMLRKKKSPWGQWLISLDAHVASRYSCVIAG